MKDSIHRNQLEISIAYVQVSDTIMMDSIHKNQLEISIAYDQ